MADNTPVVGDAPPSAPTLLSNKVYDRLKWVAQIALPAIATFYITFGNLWNLPSPEQVAASIIAFDTLLGLLLGLTTAQYMKSDARFDGRVVLTPHPEDEDATNLNVQLDPASLAEKDEITVKVDKSAV